MAECSLCADFWSLCFILSRLSTNKPAVSENQREQESETVPCGNKGTET